MSESEELDRASRDVIAAGREGVVPDEFAVERVRHAVKRTLRGSGPPVRSRSRLVPILAGLGVAALGGGLYAMELVRSSEPEAPLVPPAPAPQAARVAPPAAAPKAPSETPTVAATPPAAERSPSSDRVESPRTSRQQNLTREIDLLARVNAAANAGDGSRALALLAEYDREFRPGMLGEERAAASVLALCAAGRTAEAKAAAKRFATRWQRSPLADRVAHSCAGKQ